MKPFLFILLMLTSFYSSAQSYGVGVALTPYGSVKARLTIEVTDSTVMLIVRSDTATMNIVSRNDHRIKVTDGVGEIIFTISKRDGRIKGFRYTHQIAYKDLMNPEMVIYYYAVLN